MDIHSFHKSVDFELVAYTLEGNINAFNEIVKRYGRWIYTISLRMSGNIHDAEDATQEILIKVLTKLCTFKKKSSFKTWIYKITTNHLLDMKRSGNEILFESFETHSYTLNGLPELEIENRDEIAAGILVSELKTDCLLGMLLCLDRMQRLIFIIGALFAIKSREASEILEISEVNFRKKLSRARMDLRMYMENQCGLIDPKNKCRCAKKTQSAINQGFIDTNRLQFKEEHLAQKKILAERRIEVIDNSERFDVEKLFIDLPIPQSKIESIKILIDKEKLFNILGVGRVMHIY